MKTWSRRSPSQEISTAFFRLRASSSFTNQWLLGRALRESTNCLRCDGVESISQILFSCPRYTKDRAESEFRDFDADSLWDTLRSYLQPTVNRRRCPERQSIPINFIWISGVANRIWCGSFPRNSCFGTSLASVLLSTIVETNPRFTAPCAMVCSLKAFFTFSFLFIHFLTISFFSLLVPAAHDAPARGRTNRGFWARLFVLLCSFFGYQYKLLTSYGNRQSAVSGTPRMPPLLFEAFHHCEVILC